jgi:hypothetical protein
VFQGYESSKQATGWVTIAFDMVTATFGIGRKRIIIPELDAAR